MLHGGQAVLTFPNVADQISWVKTGSAPVRGQEVRKSDPAGWPARSGDGRDAGVRHDPVGDPDRGGRHSTSAPSSSVLDSRGGPCHPAAEGGSRPSRPVDVLVVGGGPAGAACAYWLAQAGHEVVLVEKKRYPREKTCGDALTPSSVRQLEDMGLTEELSAFHRYGGLRAHAFGRTVEMRWPERPELPDYGYIITRKDLDQLVAARAQKAGAVVREATEAVAPIVEGGLVRGALLMVQGRSGRGGRGGSGPLRRRRRRGQLPLRPLARHQPQPGLPARNGHPGLLRLPPPRRALDRELARHPRPGGQRPARLRMDLPGRRRAGQRRHRAAVHLQPVESRQHDPPHGELRRLGPGVVGAASRDLLWAADGRPAPDGAVGRPPRRAHLPARRRRRWGHQSLQRRGHRLRLRDRPHGR